MGIPPWPKRSAHRVSTPTAPDRLGRCRRARSSLGSCTATGLRLDRVVRADLENLAAVWRNSPVSALRPSEVLLVTDFDGTMADIGPDPLQTVALPGAVDALRRLSHLLKQVVVLSSRTGTDLARLVPLGGVRLIGDSGLAPLDRKSV